MNPAALNSVDDTAADWMARRLAGLSPGEEGELARWLEADPRHLAAFRRLELAWKQLQRPRDAGLEVVALTELNRRVRRRRRRAMAVACVLSGAAAVLAFTLRVAPTPAAAPVAPTTATAMVHPIVRHLPDGSTVELNAGAEIDLDFQPATRNVRLLRGEALFTVAKDANRPFIVAAGGVKVRAVGTAFNVRFDSAAVAVLVAEGQVRVDAPKAPAENHPVLVSAGEHTTVDLTHEGPVQVATLTPEEIRRALAWHSKRIEFTRTPLHEVVTVFNRESETKLVIDDPAIRELQITGIYWADDAEGFIRLLHTGLDLKAERRGQAYFLRGP